MSLGFTLNTYKQYKNDTSAFTTWLGQAAEACGRHPNPTTKLSAANFLSTPQVGTRNAPKARLKGKARKAAKQAKAHGPPGDTSNEANRNNASEIREYAITTQELSEQIEAVSQSESKVTMPSGIKKMLQRAIDLRRRCAEWYESANETVTSFDEGGHRFFIGVLQDALLKLAPVSSSNPKPTPGPAESATKPSTISVV
jgi:hypothetical protein